jgi:hypothetical protein
LDYFWRVLLIQADDGRPFPVIVGGFGAPADHDGNRPDFEQVLRHQVPLFH